MFVQFSLLEPARTLSFTNLPYWVARKYPDKLTEGNGMDISNIYIHAKGKKPFLNKSKVTFFTWLCHLREALKYYSTCSSR